MISRKRKDEYSNLFDSLTSASPCRCSLSIIRFIRLTIGVGQIFCIDTCCVQVCTRFLCEISRFFPHKSLIHIILSSICFIRELFRRSMFSISVVSSYSSIADRQLPMNSIWSFCAPLAPITLTTNALNSASDVKTVWDCIKKRFWTLDHTLSESDPMCSRRLIVLTTQSRIEIRTDASQLTDVFLMKRINRLRIFASPDVDYDSRRERSLTVNGYSVDIGKQQGFQNDCEHGFVNVPVITCIW